MKLALLLLLAVASYAEGQPMTDSARRFVRTVETREPTGINEALPMIGPYAPPRIYARWLAEIADCEKLPIPSNDRLALLEFWEVNAGDFQINGDPKTTPIAVTDPPMNRIYVSIAHIFDEQTIKHELLHYLLWFAFYPKYQGDHPLKYFGVCDMQPF